MYIDILILINNLEYFRRKNILLFKHNVLVRIREKEKKRDLTLMKWIGWLLRLVSEIYWTDQQG